MICAISEWIVLSLLSSVLVSLRTTLFILNHHYSTTIAQRGMCIHFPSTLVNKMLRWPNYWRNKLHLCFNFNQWFAPAGELQEKLSLLHCIWGGFCGKRLIACRDWISFVSELQWFSVQRFHKSPSSITFRTRTCRLLRSIWSSTLCTDFTHSRFPCIRHLSRGDLFSPQTNLRER